MFANILFSFALLLFVPLSLGQATGSDTIDHGMDMNMDMGMSLAAGQMLPYLHFQGGDVLWFQGWVPQDKGAIAGTCIGLFLLAIFDRWLNAIRVIAEVYWRKRAQFALSNELNRGSKSEARSHSHLSLPGILTMRMIPPFVPANDIIRGVLHGAQSLLNYAFMLAAMTFNASIIIAMVIGFGVGETLFGRYTVSKSTIH